MSIDGPLKSVYVVNDDDLKVNGGRWLLMGGGAIKVRGYTTDTIASRRVIGGDALPVYVLGENDIKQRGGNFRLKGGQPIRITDVIGSARGVKQGAAIAVYPVLDDGVTYDEDFLGAPVVVPTLPVSGAIVWLDATQITGLGDGDPVPQWDDMSGNGNHATQGTGAKMPAYRTGIKNSLPVVRWDGTDDEMTFAGNTDLFNRSGAVTIFAVFFSNGAGIRVIASQNETIFYTNAADGGAGSLKFQGKGVGYTTTSTVNGTIGTDWYLGAVRRASAGVNDTTLYINAVLRATGTQPIFDAGQNHLGVQQASLREWTRDIAEFVLFQSALSAADRQTMEVYFNDKWAIY